MTVPTRNELTTQQNRTRAITTQPGAGHPPSPAAHDTRRHSRDRNRNRNRNRRAASFATCFSALLVVSAGCLDESCPEGSIEIDGSCVSPDEDFQDASVGMAGSPAPGPDDADSNGMDDGQNGSNPEDADNGSDTNGSNDTGFSDELDAGRDAPELGDGVSSGDGGVAFGDGGVAFGDAGTETEDAGPIDPCDPDPCGDHEACLAENDEAACECFVGYTRLQADGPCVRNLCDLLEDESPPCEDSEICDFTGDEAFDCLCDEEQGYAECPGASECIDLQNDPYHCGACGFDCADGLECVEGECEPQVLDMAAGLASTIAVVPGDATLFAGANTDDANLTFTDVTNVAYNFLRPGADAVRRGSLSTCLLATASQQANCTDQLRDHMVVSPVIDQHTINPSNVYTLSGVIHDVATGYVHNCMIVGSNREVRCWGSNYYYGFGTDDIEGSRSHSDAVTVQAGITTLTNIAEVGVGSSMSCARLQSGSIYCWGNRSLPSDSGYQAPSTVVSGSGSTLPDAEQLCVGNTFGCALSGGSGDVVCWSNHSEGQFLVLGRTSESVAEPHRYFSVDGLESIDVEAITCGAAHACARTSEGEVYCWGSNGSGQLGDPTFEGESRQVAHPVAGIEDVTQVFSGPRALHTCAHTRRGGIFCWGSNAHGQFGIGQYDNQFDVPQPVSIWP